MVGQIDLSLIVCSILARVLTFDFVRIRRWLPSNRAFGFRFFAQIAFQSSMAESRYDSQEVNADVARSRSNVRQIRCITYFGSDARVLTFIVTNKQLQPNERISRPLDVRLPLPLPLSQSNPKSEQQPTQHNNNDNEQ